MNSNDLNQIIQENDEFIDDLKKGRKTIDPEKGKTYYQKKVLGGKEEYTGTLSDNLARSISMYKEYKNTDHPFRIESILECNGWITKALTSNAVVVGNSTIQELEKYKERCSELETDLDNRNSEKRQLEDELLKIKSVIDSAVRANPHLRPFFNFDEESEVEGVNDQPR